MYIFEQKKKYHRHFRTDHGENVRDDEGLAKIAKFVCTQVEVG